MDIGETEPIITIEPVPQTVPEKEVSPVPEPEKVEVPA